MAEPCTTVGDECPTHFARVAQVAEIPEEGMLGVVLPDGDLVCLASHAGAIVALAGHCTHQECPLADGAVLPDGTVECIWHGARFDLRTGAVRRGPAREPLPVYEVRVEDGAVWVGGRRP